MYRIILPGRIIPVIKKGTRCLWDRRNVYRIVLYVSTLIHFGLAGQDQLWTKDSIKVLVSIVEVGTEEIRYRLFKDADGAIYVENKKNVSFIIYENGNRQSFRPEPDGQAAGKKTKRYKSLTRADSSVIYTHKNDLSANLVNLLNNEVGLLYRHEFYESHFSISVPIAIGFGVPHFTQRIADNRKMEIRLDRKVFEIGIGASYYPTYNTTTNYYIGPVLRYMAYDVKDLNAWADGILSRYAFSITTGFVFRTRSGLISDLFISAGISNDKLTSTRGDPAALPPRTFTQPTRFYLWTGILVGFCF